MAATLALVRRDDFSSDIDTLSLLGYTAGFQLAEDGWDPMTPLEGQDALDEAMTLRVSGSSHDNLAAVLQPLSQKRLEAGWYESGAERYGVWLRAKLTNETNTRQALVKKLNHAARRMHSRAVSAGNKIPEYTLHVRRTPYWEATSSVDYALTSLNSVGGSTDYTTYGGSPGVVVGDVAARLASVKFSGVNGDGGPLNKFWLGFRTNRYGNRANFQSTWSLRNAFYSDTDTSKGTTNPDATAKDGYKTITTFATVPTLLTRIKCRVTDITANPTDQRGNFTVLLRAKTTGTAVVRLRLGDGLQGDATFNYRSRVTLSWLSWQFVELGSVQIPNIGRLVEGSSYASNTTLVIDAERVSGSGNLEMDCLIMVPTDEGWLYGEGGSVEYTGGDSRPFYVQEKADGRKEAMAFASSLPSAVGTAKITGGLPVGNGILVLGAMRATSSTLTDVCNLDMRAYPRWESLRGAE